MTCSTHRQPVLASISVQGYMITCESQIEFGLMRSESMVPAIFEMQVSGFFFFRQGLDGVNRPRLDVILPVRPWGVVFEGNNAEIAMATGSGL